MVRESYTDTSLQMCTVREKSQNSDNNGAY